MPRDLDALHTFARVMESRSITEAARRQGVTKSAVSRRLGALERDMGVTLFQRSTRSMVPTEAGTLLHRRLMPLLVELDDLAVGLDAGAMALEGTLRIAAPVSFGTRYLMPALVAFIDEHPRLRLDIDLDDRRVDLLAGRHDLAVRIDTMPDSELVVRPVQRSRRVLCCSPAYAQGRGVPVSPAELTAHECIGYSNATAAEIWRFEHVTDGRVADGPVSDAPAPDEPVAHESAGADPSGAGRGAVRVPVTIGHVANNGEAVADLALAGHGITVLPTFIVAAHLADGRLRRIDLHGLQPVPDTIGVVYPKMVRTPAKVAAFTAFLLREWGPDCVPPWER